MNPTTDGRVTYEMVERKVTELEVDPNVQRSLRKARVTQIANEFRPDAIGVLTTSFRSSELIHVIDGQHRLRAAQKAGYEGKLQTMEYRGLTIPEEAALFRLLNTAEKPSRIDRFLVLCVEQNADALRLAKFLDKHGWSLSVSVGGSRLSAIASLERVYALSPEAADATLSVLTAAYGHEPAAVQGMLIEGLGRMLARYGRDVDLKNLAERLAAFPGGALGLVGHARGQSMSRTGNLSDQVAKVVTNLYNQRRKSSALPAWS